MTENLLDEKLPYIRVALLVYGGHPDNVTQALGLKPDLVRVKGSPGRTREGPPLKLSTWEIFSRPDRYSCELEPYLDSLLRRISLAESRICNLNRKLFSVEICASVDAFRDGITPALVLSPGMMRELAALGAGLDIDLHIWDSETFPKHAKEGLLNLLRPK